MDPLFSHSPAPDDSTAAVAAPQTVTVHVPAAPEQAAEGFLDYLHLWWPVSLYSVSGPGAYLWWDDEGIAEESEKGERLSWGPGRQWAPPESFSCLLSLPGAEGDEWSVRIEGQGTGSEVSITAPLPRQRPQGTDPIPDTLWSDVLGFYARFMGA